MKLVPFGYCPRVLKLKVVPDTEPGSDAIFLAVVDSAGEPVERGCLLEITPNGFDLVCGVDSKLGLPLDDHGRLVRIEDAEPDDEVPGEVPEEVGNALSEVKTWLTHADDRPYNDATRLSECRTFDTEEVTIGHLRTLVAALEARL